MNRSLTPIIAAIPNYNMATGLKRLLPTLITQGYDAIYVLDDASTDDSIDVVAKYPQVQWVANSRNTGASGARNLVFKEIPESSIIHFLDADVVPITKSMPSEIRKIVFHKNTGFVGGLVVDQTGTQTTWNYGPAQNLPTLVSTALYLLLTPLSKTTRGAWIHRLFPNRPQGIKDDKSIHPQWVLEANMIIHSDVLKQFGAFDERLREHDIQPLAIKLDKAQYVNEFVSTITVCQYTDLHVRSYNRLLKLAWSEWYIAKHYRGFKQWLLPILK